MRSTHRAVLVGTLASFAVVASARAQDVQYRTTSKVEMKGALGAIAKIASKFGGGGTGDAVQTTSIKGARMRTDDGDQSSVIVDLDKSSFTMLDHRRKTYTVVTVAQMAQALDSLSKAMAPAQAAAQPQPAAGDGGRADVKFDLKVDPTGEKKPVAGADAERTWITLTTDVAYTPEGETKAEDAGRIVMFVDQWNSKDHPAWKAMQEFQRKTPAMFEQQGSRSSAALAGQPGMTAAMAKAAEEASKIEGLDMLSTTYMVMVAPDKQFDRTLAMSEKPVEEKKGPSASDVAKSALGGILGRKKQEEKPAQEEPPPDQVTLVVVTQQVTDVSTASLPASLFEVPAGYREVNFGAN
jgi:hypothetical protein